MTTSLIPLLAPPAQAAVGKRLARRSSAPKGWTARIPGRVRRIPETALIGLPGWIANQAADAGHPVSAPGVIGGAVISAARRSASLSQRKLARVLTVSPATVRSWENGTRPLFCVGYDQLCQLAEALRQAGAQVGQEADELILASQCDLLITGILRGFEDYAELPPVDQEVAGASPRGLIRWALTGQVPDRYWPQAASAPLLTGPDVLLFTTIARDLQAGSRGSQLVSYGTALVALASPMTA